MLTLVPKLTLGPKVEKYKILTLVPKLTLKLKLVPKLTLYKKLTLYQSWHSNQKIACSAPPPAPPHLLLVSLQASHQNYLLWIYKIQPPFTDAFNWARHSVKPAVKLEENLSKPYARALHFSPCQKIRCNLNPKAQAVNKADRQLI